MEKAQATSSLQEQTQTKRLKEYLYRQSRDIRIRIDNNKQKDARYNISFRPPCNLKIVVVYTIPFKPWSMGSMEILGEAF